MNKQDRYHWEIVIVFSVILILFSFPNWKSLFTISEPSGQEKPSISLISQFRDNVSELIDSDSFRYKYELIDLSGLYARITGRRLFNDVVKLNNGMLSVQERISGSDEVSIMELGKLNDFVKSYGGKFYYVQFPYKMDLDEKLVPSGLEKNMDINNQADEFVRRIAHTGVPVINTISALARTPADIEKYFYRTDHHWKPSAAFKAFQLVMNIVFEDFPEQTVPEEIMNEKNWSIHEIADSFLGSRGKRVGKYYGGTDSLEWLTPNFETFLSSYEQSSNVFISGDYESTCLKKEYLTLGNSLFEKSNYYLYVGGDFPFVQYRNWKAPMDLHVLIIKDSFTLPVQSYYAVLFQELDVIDPRYFSECSISEYVDRTKPDLVMMELNPDLIRKGFIFQFGDPVPSDEENFDLIPPTDIQIGTQFSDEKNYSVVFDRFDKDSTYTVKIPGFSIPDGAVPGINLTLYDSTDNQILTKTAMDTDYCNSFGNCFWTFQTPKEMNGSLELRVYNGIMGETGQNVQITLEGFQLTKGKQQINRNRN